MANIVQINKKIKSVKLTSRLTKSLEIVSQTQFYVYKELQKKSLPYLRGIYKVFFEVFNSPDHDVRVTNKKLISIDSGKNVLWVVIGTDIGMCGDFNDKLNKYLKKEFDKQKDGLILYGNKLSNIMNHAFKSKIHFKRKSEVNSKEVVKTFREMSRTAFEIFMNEHYQKLNLLYVKNPKLGIVEKVNILPFTEKYFPNKKNVFIKTMEGELDFPDSVIEIFPQYFECIMMGSLITSKISEHGTRRELMHAAAKNAIELLDEYTIIFNKLRQEKITQEITEIVAAVQQAKKS